MRPSRRIIERTELTIAGANRQGLSPFRLIEGWIGNAARAMGGRLLAAAGQRHAGP